MPLPGCRQLAVEMIAPGRVARYRLTGRIESLLCCSRRLAAELIDPGRVVRLLEVGAGAGRLAHHLSAARRGE